MPERIRAVRILRIPGRRDGQSFVQSRAAALCLGVSYDAGKVIGDLELGLEVRSSMQARPMRHIASSGCIMPIWTKGRAHHVAGSDQRGHAGSLAARPGAKTTFEPLLLSSKSAEPLPPSASMRCPIRRRCAMDSNPPARATPLPRA